MACSEEEKKLNKLCYIKSHSKYKIRYNECTVVSSIELHVELFEQHPLKYTESGKTRKLLM